MCNFMSKVCAPAILKTCFSYDKDLLWIAATDYLPPARREIIKRIPCVCLCVIECVSRFYKGLYITLVVSPWPFQCFL